MIDIINHFSAIVSPYYLLAQVSQIRQQRDISLEDIFIEAVKANGEAICLIPFEYITPAVQFAAVKQDTSLIEYIFSKADFLNAVSLKAVLYALSINGNLIKFIPTPSERLQLIAINQFSLSIRFIPEELCSEKVLTAAVERLVFRGNYFEFIKTFKDENKKIIQRVANKLLSSKEQQLLFIKEDYKNIKYIPRKFLSEQVILEAVKINTFVVKHIPAKFLSKKVQLAVVKRTGSLIDCIPEKLLSEQVCIEAIKNCDFAIKHVPPTLLSENVCFAAVKHDGYALICLYDKGIIPSEKVQLAAVKRCGDVLENICKAGTPTEEMCLAAVKNNGRAIRYVPQEFLSKQIQSTALKQNGLAVKYIQTEKLSEEICLEAVTENGLAMQYVPPIFQTKQMQITALKQNPRALKFIKELQVELLPRLTNDMCLISMEPLSSGEKYKMCSNREDHIVSLDSWMGCESKFMMWCSYCKFAIKKEIYVNLEN